MSNNDLPSVGFSIITNGDKYNALSRVLDSIYALNVPNSKILVCGNSPVSLSKDIIHLPFDEETYPNKIGMKKNVANAALDTDIIVHLHDYISFQPDWWEGYKKFGFDWDICMNVVNEYDGKRNCDWMRSSGRTASKLNGNIVNCSLVDYDDYSQMDYLYIQGNYWVSKKYVIENDPIDPTLSAGQAEDVEWSDRVIPKYNYKMNPHSTVKYLKINNLPNL